jgi:hypothetical protein
LCILGAMLVFPFHSLLYRDLIGYKGGEFNLKVYDEVYFDFGMDYERANPLSRKNGFKTYLTKLRDAGIISQVEYMGMLGVIDKSDVNILELYHRNTSQNKGAVKTNKKAANNFVKAKG